MNPFEFVNAINAKTPGLDPEDAEYQPFLINRAFSFYLDTIFHAASINQYPDIPKTMSYDYYFYGISKKKRWSKWAKKLKDKDLDNIMAYYSCSYKKAQDAQKILTDKQLKEISKSLDKGG